MKQTKRVINVVLIEDDPYYNKLLTKYVHTICNGSLHHGFDFNIKSYFTAHDSIEELEDDWDILLLDYFLFNRDESDILSGADVMKEVKKHCPECKVIIVSGMKNESTIDKLQDAGIYAYVDKNVSSMNRIGALIQEILDAMKLEEA